MILGNQPIFLRCARTVPENIPAAHLQHTFTTLIAVEMLFPFPKRRSCSATLVCRAVFVSCQNRNIGRPCPLVSLSTLNAVSTDQFLLLYNKEVSRIPRIDHPFNRLRKKCDRLCTTKMLAWKTLRNKKNLPGQTPLNFTSYSPATISVLSRQWLCGISQALNFEFLPICTN